MDSKVIKITAARPRAKTYYERWMEKEGVPIVEGFGVTDVRNIALKYWKRLGCDGAYLQLRGLEGITGVYLGKMAPGGTLHPERHLYEKVIYIMQGEGVAEIQQRDRVPQNIQWQTGSLFSPPLNSLHRLINYSNEPVIFLAVTTAPMALDHYHNEQFVFNSDFSFNDRYDGEPGYFEPSNERYLATNNRQWIWETNFITDARRAKIDAQEQKGAGVNITQFEISNNTLIGHLADITRRIITAAARCWWCCARKAILSCGPIIWARGRTKMASVSKSCVSTGCPAVFSVRRPTGFISILTPGLNPRCNWRCAAAARSFLWAFAWRRFAPESIHRSKKAAR